MPKRAAVSASGVVACVLLSGCSVWTAERSTKPCREWQECVPPETRPAPSRGVKPPRQGKTVDVSRHEKVVFTDPTRTFFCRLSAEMATCSLPKSVQKTKSIPLQRKCDLGNVNGIRLKTNAYFTCTRDLISSKLDSGSDEVAWFPDSRFAAMYKDNPRLAGRAVVASGYGLKHGDLTCSVMGRQVNCVRGSDRAWFVITPGEPAQTRLSVGG